MNRLFKFAMYAVIVLASHATAVESEKPLNAEKLFQQDHVVDVVIDIDEERWDELRAQSRSFTSALGETLSESPYTYQRANVTIDGVLIRDVGIRKKGFLGSQSRSRPSLKIKFHEYVDQSPVSGLDRITLNNNKQDPSRMIQYLAYKIFNDTGTIAPRCNFARVTVNGKYLGVYSNVEPIKPFFLERFGDDSGPLYEGAVTDFFPDFVKKFELKNKRASYAQIEELTAIINEAPLDLGKLERAFDIDAFLRFWAVESLIGFWDGYTNDQNNYFVYVNPINEKAYFVPWGADSAFTHKMPIPPYIIPHKSVHSQAVLANRLYRIKEIQERYHTTFQGLLEDYWNEEELLAEVDRIQKLIEPFLHEDNRGHKDATRRLRRFIENRRVSLDKEIAKWPVQFKKKSRLPPILKQVGTASVTFDTEWYAKTPSSPDEVGTLDIELLLDGEPVAFRKVGTYAQPNRNAPKDRVDGRRPPTVVFHGRRESDGKQLILGIGIDADDFKPTSDARVKVEGLVIEGNPLLFFASLMFRGHEMKWIQGSASFASADMEVGASVAGDMSLRIMRFVGGHVDD